jgi:hypothetical protein
MDITANVVIADGFTPTDIKDEFEVALKQYLPTVEKIVSYFRISELLFDCAGVEDVLNYTLNGGTDSVTLTETDYPVVGGVSIVTGG